MIIYFNYITTNKINGKRYVGAHKTDNIDDGYLGSGKYLLRAIKKYGKESFTRKIINKTDTIEQAHKNEKFLVEVFETLVSNGYNISPTGGLGVLGSCIGELNGMYEKHHSGESIQNMREAHIGVPLSEEHCKSISEALIGREFSEEWRDNLRKAAKGVPKSEEHKKHIGDNSRGTKWINNGKINKKVKEEKLPEFLANGWKLRRVKKQKK